MLLRRDELKAFLRARRAALTPDSVGLASTARRKTPGLRREEVASMAQVGATWYTWLEQGRHIRVSPDALERIGRALRLSQSDMAYLFALVGIDHPAAAPGRASPVDLPIKLAVESITGMPAIALDPHGYVLAFNPVADRVYDLDDHGWRFGNNHLWRLFGDPARIALYGGTWHTIARNAVGILRTNYTSRASDAGFDDLLDALRATGDEFPRLWEEHYTAPVAQTLDLTLHHDKLGRLSIYSTRFVLASSPGHVLFIQPAADERTAFTFARLARSS